jgi:hypothetical protein
LRSSSAALRRFSAGFAKQLGSLSEPAYSVEGNLLIVSRHEAPFSVDEVDGVDTVDRKRRGDVHHVHHVHFVHQGSGAPCLVVPRAIRSISRKAPISSRSTMIRTFDAVVEACIHTILQRTTSCWVFPHGSRAAIIFLLFSLDMHPDT